MILGLVDEALASGARLKQICGILGLDARTIQRWRSRSAGEDLRAGPRSKPRNALSVEERRRALSVMNNPRFRDKSPKQIVPILADEGKFIASESTLYRILRDENQAQHRSSSRMPTKRHKPNELKATGPSQVWSWDITYLRSDVRGSFFYLYMVLDVWSRKIVGFDVHERECSELAAQLMEQTCLSEGVTPGEVTVHSDNGAPMKSGTMLATLQVLGVTPSFSRPSVSNDNAYSESAFRTAKYRPEFPSRPFASLEEARRWAEPFVRWYNDEHRHSSIQFVTPNDRHGGKETAILEARATTYEKARKARPERWSANVRDWSPVEEVILNPDQEPLAID